MFYNAILRNDKKFFVFVNSYSVKAFFDLQKCYRKTKYKERHVKQLYCKLKILQSFFTFLNCVGGKLIVSKIQIELQFGFCKKKF